MLASHTAFYNTLIEFGKCSLWRVIIYMSMLISILKVPRSPAEKEQVTSLTHLN